MNSSQPALASLFAASMRHELRTSLNSIQALSRLLLEPEENLPAEQRIQAAFIQASANQLAAMVDHLQLLAALDAGAELPEPEPPDSTRFAVVVLDSEPGAAVLYECYLCSSGFQALPAGTAEEAGQLAARHGAIAVLLDESCGSAPELADRLRGRGRAAPLVVALSTAAEPPLPWADATLVRPANRKRLLELLRRRAREERAGRVVVLSAQASTRILIRDLLAGTRYQIGEASGTEELLQHCERQPPLAILWDVGAAASGSGRPLQPVALDIPVIMVTTSGERDQPRCSASPEGDALCIGSMSRQAAASKLRQALGQAEIAPPMRAEVTVGPQLRSVDPQYRERGR